MMEGETPTSMMLSFKVKGNDSIKLGQQNKAKNIQYYRDAVNHYSVAIGWSEKVECGDDAEAGKDDVTQGDDAARSFGRAELEKVQSVLYSNKAMAHTFLKNWGYVIDDAAKATGLDAKNVKAWYRLAKARESRREWSLCLEACEGGLLADKENKLLKKLAAKVSSDATKER